MSFKRSRTVALSMMGLAPVLLAACTANEPSYSSAASEAEAVSPKPPAGPTAYETVDDCVFDGQDRSVCEQGYRNAQEEAARSAPRFATGPECTLEFETCQPAPAVAAAAPSATQPAQASSGGFMPLLAGFMIGQSLSNSGPGYASSGFQQADRDDRRGSSGGSFASSALYRARGGQLSQVSGLSNGKATIAPVRARTVTSASVAATKTARAQAQARAQQTRAASSTRSSVSRSGFGGRSGGYGS